LKTGSDSLSLSPSGARAGPFLGMSADAQQPQSCCAVSFISFLPVIVRPGTLLCGVRPWQQFVMLVVCYLAPQ
jgi:hypothetical protein